MMEEPVQPLGLVARVKNIILTPDTEWQIIAAEPASIGAIYRSYVIPLAAIPPVCMFLRSMLFGYSVLGMTYRPGLLSTLSSAIVHYVLSLAVIYLLAVIIDLLAPTFGGQKDLDRSFKVAAYSATASWLAGFAYLIPGISILALLGLYSIYLFYRGLPILTRSPPEKSIPFTAVVFVAAVIASVVISAVSRLFVDSGTMPGVVATASPSAGAVSGMVALPGGGQLDLGKLQQFGKAMEQATHPADPVPGSAAPTAVAPDRLKALLPAQLPDGTARTELSTGAGQIAGFGGASAEARYDVADKSTTLTVTDLGAAGALAALGGAFGVQGTRETATSYSKLDQVGGNTVSEEYDRETKHGKYMIVVASRFMVAAEGNNVSMDDLKADVALIDTARLEALGQ